MHTHLLLVHVPDRQCHHCVAVGPLPGVALAFTAQGLRLDLPHSRRQELGDFTPEQFPVWVQPCSANSCSTGIFIFVVVTLL